MPTYNASAVSDSVIAHKKGITLQQIRALRDNYLAIAEGASGAPKVEGAALDIFRGNYSINNSSVVINNLDRVKNLELFFTMNTTSTGTEDFKFRCSNNGGSSYGSYINIAGISRIDSSTSGQAIGYCSIDLVAGSGLNLGIFRNTSLGFVLFNASLSFTPVSNTNTVEFAAESVSVAFSLKEIGGYV